MPRVPSVFALVFLAASLAACSGGTTSTPTPEPEAPGIHGVVQFTSSTQKLAFPRLQIGATTYTDVQLKLLADGTWSLDAAGKAQPGAPLSTEMAVMTAPKGQPSLSGTNVDAEIKIARLHMDGRVMMRAVLRLAGNKWSFPAALQESHSYTHADFKANTQLIASERSHVVLNSAPGQAAQGFPLQLEARRYRFCMDAQAEGGDTMSLSDPGGKNVFKLKAGDACAEVRPTAAGVYRMEHAYGGSGSKRTVFLRPKAGQAPPSKKTAIARQFLALNDVQPEYWSAYATAGSAKGMLSFYGKVNGSNCFGSWNLGDKSDAANTAGQLIAAGTQFRITRDAANLPANFGAAWLCDASGTNYTYQYGDIFGATSIDLFLVPSGFAGITALGSAFTISNFASNQFQLNTGLYMFPYVVFGPTDRLANDIGYFYLPPFFGSFPYASDVVLRIGIPSQSPTPFQLVSRFFPNGIPSNTSVQTGEVAFYSGANCQGQVTTAFNVPSSVLPDVRRIAGLNAQSLLLGPNTTIAIYPGADYTGTPKVYDNLGCQSLSMSAGAAFDIAVDTVELVISTNSCVSCNLAGFDFSGLSLQYVQLSSAELSNANLNSADLTGANLSSTSMANADLSFSNLEGANLTSANLAGTAALPAALLTGARMKNVSMPNAVLEGVNFFNASFFGPQADATGAKLAQAIFTEAYLAGANFSGAHLEGANFDGAVLTGASFVGATLANNSGTGNRVSFINALLQGANFSGATMSYANFTGASVDLSSRSGCINVGLPKQLAMFKGFQAQVIPNPATPGEPTSMGCVASAAAPVCVAPTYPAAALPGTGADTICVDKSNGPCTAASWGQATPVLPTSACPSLFNPNVQALCGTLQDVPPSAPSKCW